MPVPTEVDADAVTREIESVGDILAAMPITKWIVAILLVLVALVLGRLAFKAIRRTQDWKHTDSSAVNLVARIVQSLIVVVGIATALDLAGINLAPLFASAGVVSIILGFALRDIAENYIAGLILGFRRPFLVGEVIRVADEYEGTVQQLGLRYVLLHTYAGLRVYVPNSVLLKEALVNVSREGERRDEFEVGVDYGTDLEEALKLAVEAASAVPSILQDPAPDAWVQEFGNSSITVLVRYWYDPTGNSAKFRSDTMIAVKRAYDEAGIVMPAPVLAVELGK